MKKITKIVLCLSVLLLLTGCNNKKEVKKEKSKGKCKVVDCINLIGVKDNLEKVNEIIGFSGTKEEDNTYRWKLNSNDSVLVTFNDTTNTIKIYFSDETIKNKKTSFSKYNEVEKKLKDGESVTYEELNKLFKSNGVLIEKTNIELKYRWVDKEESYLDATINATNNKCYKLNGMI